MGKNIADQQGRQQDEGVATDPKTAGRRFKPGLGHHNLPAATARRGPRGGCVWRGHPPARAIRGRQGEERAPSVEQARAGAPTAPVGLGAPLVTMPIVVSAPQQH